MFDKVLVANRGEIAVRVIRGCRKLGYRTVAVYSEADRNAVHVDEADEALCIGPPAAGESYLASDNILQAARASGAGAIHPGYGFLAERADFCRAVQEAGLVFIGPDPASIQAMGNKSESKNRMLAAGVPCVPGYQGHDQSDATLVAEALKVGLPVMVKAAAGGGGRGMRLVHAEADLAPAIASARSEARSAFGDDQLLVERAVVDSRHVEFQVFGDRHGNVVHLGERDCSVQRRNQKVVEESPSPAVSEDLRRRMGVAAVAAARAVKYVGAGTVEFMLAGDGQFYFLEMNTRLQVEHPVTEMVYGLDLVEWQLRVAQGQPLPLAQEAIDARRQGWAMEVRLCTEDPARGFMPQTGPVLAWHPPSGPDMRVDHALRRGGVISPYYDSMQAKLIAHGKDRDEARRRLLQMIDDTVLMGVNSNLDFLAHIVGHPVFAAGHFSTSFIAEHFPAETIAASRRPDALHVALAAALLYHGEAGALQQDAGMDRELVGWQSSFPALVDLRLRCGEETVEAGVTDLGGNRYEVSLPQGKVALQLQPGTAPDVSYSHDGVTGRASAVRVGDTLWLSHADLSLAYTDVSLQAAEKGAAGSDGRLLAPIDGKVVSVTAQVGDRVCRGQTLAVLEAMKMEFLIASGVDGLIEAVSCQPGQQVKARQLLIALKPAN